MINNIIKTLKVNHYLKNAIVFIPLIFSMSFTPNAFIKEFGMFVSFCLISSAVYIFNDIIDKEKDKFHPIKCKRPIARGDLPINIAIFILVILICVSLFLTYKISILCLSSVLTYFILNIFYSFKLKNIVLIDVATIAFGFILRILSGCFAISVVASPLVILLTFFMSMFFTFSKRKLEIQLLKDKNLHRQSLKNFDIDTVKQFILLTGVLSITFYFTYVLDARTIQKTGADYLFITVIPFTLIIFRLLYLVNTQQIADDPIIFVEKDLTIKYLSVLYLLVLFAALNF